MDRMASLTAFVRVVESGGFTAAARRLDLSITTVSNQVQVLEDSLGVRLLNRTTRRVNLTEIGREYYERCSQVLQELAEADAVATALQVTPRGRLRIHCHPGLDRLIAPVVTRFLGDYPEVTLDLHTGAMIDPLQKGFDIAIVPTPPPDSTLIRRPLAKWHYLLCCAPAYLKTHSMPRHPADLVDHKCMIYSYSMFGPDFHFIDPVGNPVSARVSGNLVTTSIVAMRSAAVAGLALWLCPPFIVSDLLASKALVPLLPDYGTPEMEIVALYPHRRQLSTKVRLFLDLLVERFAEQCRWLDATPDR
jgi:DNA-binding transcriptional LysR family regulator